MHSVSDFAAARIEAAQGNKLLLVCFNMDDEAANDRAQEVLRLGLQKQSSHQAETARLEAHAAAVEKRLELLRNDGLEDKL